MLSKTDLSHRDIEEKLGGQISYNRVRDIRLGRRATVDSKPPYYGGLEFVIIKPFAPAVLSNIRNSYVALFVVIKPFAPAVLSNITICKVALFAINGERPPF